MSEASVPDVPNVLAWTPEDPIGTVSEILPDGTAVVVLNGHGRLIYGNMTFHIVPDATRTTAKIVEVPDTTPAPRSEA